MIAFALRRFGLAVAVTVMTDAELERRVAEADELLGQERAVQESQARELLGDASGEVFEPGG